MNLHTSSSKFRCTLDPLTRTVQIPESVSNNTAEGRISVSSAGASQHVQGPNAVWYCGKYIAEMSLDAVDLLGADGNPQVVPAVDLGPIHMCGADGGPPCADAVCDHGSTGGCHREVFLTNNPTLITALGAALGNHLSPDRVWAVRVGRDRTIALAELTDGSIKAFDVRDGKLVELKFAKGDDSVPPYGLGPEEANQSVLIVQAIDLLRSGTRQLVIRAHGISAGMTLSEYHVYTIEDTEVRQVFSIWEKADGCTGSTDTEVDQFDLCTGAGYAKEEDNVVTFSDPTDHTPREIRIANESRVGKVRLTETARWVWNGHRFALDQTPSEKAVHSVIEAKLRSEAHKIELSLKNEAHKAAAKDKVPERQKEPDRRRKPSALE